MESDRAQRIPLWSIALAGWLMAGALRESQPAPSFALAARVPALDARSLGHLSARELRALPGLGEKRSLALVDARWERAPGDPPLLLGDLAGIGGVVESAVRSALASGGALEPGTALESARAMLSRTALPSDAAEERDSP